MVGSIVTEDELMPSHCHQDKTLQYIERLYNSSSIDDAFDALNQELQTLGFDAALYGFSPRLASDESEPAAPVFKIADDYCPAFIEHYFSEGLAKDDFTIRLLMQGRQQRLDWWECSQKGMLSDVEESVLGMGRYDFGIQNGITLPTMNNSRGFGAVSMITAATGEDYIKLRVQAEKKAEVYARIFQEHINSNVNLYRYLLEPLISKLSSTEKRVLPFIASGKPMKTINLNPAISEKYAEKLVYSIRKKFGNISKARLIYYIGLLHMLDGL
jgi:DNA-binding CsgD family transcriptional regulator